MLHKFSTWILFASVNSYSTPFRFFLFSVALHLQENMQVELNPLLFVAIKIFRNSLLEDERYGHKFLCLKYLKTSF